jgi:hypothetical protein
MSIANVLRRASDIDRQAAEAARPSVRALRRHLHAGIPHGVFPRRPVALVAPMRAVIKDMAEIAIAGFDAAPGAPSAMAATGAAPVNGREADEIRFVSHHRRDRRSVSRELAVVPGTLN